VHQLTVNLCSNAIHAMDKGGTLEVGLEQLELPEVRELSHGVLPAGCYVVLMVRDTGSGIGPAELEHIFEPFYTTRRTAGGTGLGLALVYAIVTELEGAIDVETAAGGGSTFRLYLPATDAAEVERMEEDRTLPRGNGQRVLLVEDEQALMLLEEEMLAALNYEPVGFMRSADALAEFFADPSKFDAVLLDQLMPDITGVELAKRMRELRDGLPIVLITGYTGPLLAQEARAAGVHHILPKPLNFRQLAQALDMAFHARVPSPPMI
jgi:CheY-like chemotaxis protein